MFENRKPKAKVVQPSKLDPYKPLIQSWLEDDRKNRYKQRHTAQRIHNRLVEECPEYDASYPLVQRYVRSLQEARHQEGTLYQPHKFLRLQHRSIECYLVRRTTWLKSKEA